MTTKQCPYCDKEAKPRGLRNHVRLSSGNGHGDKGTVPDDFDANDAVDADAEADEPDADESDAEPVEDTEADTDARDARDAAEVTAQDLTTDEDTEADTDESDASDGKPFDADDPDAVRLDGDETLYVRHGGKIAEAKPSEGDYLLITDNGPVLWDCKTDDRYEVVTE